MSIRFNQVDSNYKVYAWSKVIVFRVLICSIFSQVAGILNKFLYICRSNCKKPKLSMKGVRNMHSFHTVFWILSKSVKLLNFYLLWNVENYSWYFGNWCRFMSEANGVLILSNDLNHVLKNNLLGKYFFLFSEKINMGEKITWKGDTNCKKLILTTLLLHNWCNINE